ncbi:MAG: hypothetical protein NC418_05785 [Muribaculaceae bacterium]|nr:hypothetical protein [Muribaculaceae bacterium]
MLTFLKYLIQLILSPGSGWEDIERTRPDAEELLRRGLYPLLGLTAATEFLAFAYQRHADLAVVLMRAVSDFGAYFVAIFIARLIFDLYLARLCDVKPEPERVACLTVCGIGLMVLVQLLSNCLPWNLVLLKFLPVYVVLVLYKAMAYIGVRRRDALRYTGLAAAAIVAVPLAIYYLLYLLIQ